MTPNQSKQTIEKQDRYETFVRSYSKQTPKSFGLWDWYAGQGRYHIKQANTRVLGSPILAANALAYRPDVKIKALEFNYVSLELLKLNSAAFCEGATPALYRGSCFNPPIEFVPKPESIGLSYFDPPGGIKKSLITNHSELYPNVDILIRAQITSNKRSAERAKIENELNFVLNTNSKKHWYVTRPYAQQGWSFVFGTNRDDYVLPKYFVETTADRHEASEDFVYREMCIAMIFQLKHNAGSAAYLGFTKSELTQWKHPPMEDGSYMVDKPA